LIYTGTVDWCSTVRVVNPAEASTATLGQPWTGARVGQPWPGAHDELDFGEFDSKEQWAGWFTATDADSGEVRWRYKAAAPVLAAITPTEEDWFSLLI
jgi:alcohol dehydrogenase (cytochrome c)